MTAAVNYGTATDRAPNHRGEQRRADADLFAAPPPEIGTILSAESTLTRGERETPLGKRLALAAGFAVIFSGIIGACCAWAVGSNRTYIGLTLFWACAFGIIGSCVGLAATGFSHKCTYIGTNGAATFSLRRRRNARPTGSKFLFANATELRAGERHLYYNGIYAGTEYKFKWINARRRSVFRVEGMYWTRKQSPTNVPQYHFARAMELAWGEHFLRRAQEQLCAGGAITFQAGWRRVIHVGDGFMEFRFGRRHERLTPDEIKTAILEHGNFSITRKKTGPSSSGRPYSFAYAELANAKVFLFALDTLLGISWAGGTSAAFNRRTAQSQPRTEMAENPESKVPSIPQTNSVNSRGDCTGAGDSRNPRSRHQRLTHAAIILVGVCGLSVAVAAFGWFHGGPRSAAASPTAHLSADQVFASASPAVVKVLVRDSRFQIVGQGSGFYVSDDGRIVTNYHVIKDASFATIVETGGTIRGVDSVIATDPDADLAILKVSRSSGPTLRLANSLPKIGARVYALGNPQGFTDTLSEGIVSGLRDDQSVPTIQTTAAISAGSSGGPLIGEDGTVVGVTTSFWTAGQSLNFAVPAIRISQLLVAPAGNASKPALVRSGTSSPAAAKIIEDALRRIERDDYRGALDELEPLRESESNNPMYLCVLACLHYGLHNNEQTIALIDRAIQITPDSAWCYSLRGSAFKELHRWQDALTSFQLASRQSGGKSAEVYYHAGTCYYNLDDYEHAEKCYAFALKLDERFSDTYGGLALLYMRTGRNAAALDVCQRGIAIDPSKALLYDEAGGIYSAWGQQDKAIQMWENAVRFDPNGPIGQGARKDIDRATQGDN